MNEYEITMFSDLARGLARQFGPNCEIIVHDLTAEDLNNTIVVIENGHVSGRHKGDGPSHIVLEALRADPKELNDRLAYLTKTKDGKILKSSTIFLRDENGKPKCVFSINYDITVMKAMENELRNFTMSNAEVNANEPEMITQNVEDLLDELIEQSAKLVGKPAAIMTKADRVQAIRFLNDSGAFLITKSGQKVCNYFGISKYTLYSYIDEAKAGAANDAMNDAEKKESVS